MTTASTEETAAKSRGRLLLLAAAVLWSLSGVIAKGLRLDPLPIAFYRSLFAGLALLPFVRPSRMTFRPVMVPSALLFGTMIGLYIASIKMTTAANAIFLQCSATFWVVPASVIFLRERLDRRDLAGIALATVGIALIVFFGRDGRPGEGRGIALGLGSGVCFAAVVIVLRQLRDLDPFWLSAVNNLGGALALGAWMTLQGAPPPIPSGREFAVLAVFGIVQMAIPYAMFARGLKTIPAPEAGLIGLLEPILNPIWVVAVHGERPAGPTIAGGALLLAGVACRYLLPARLARRKAEGGRGGGPMEN